MITKKSARPGIIDTWNAFMCEGAKWSPNDIPRCPTILTEIPSSIITWIEAKSIYKKRISKDPSFKDNSFVCFYIDDQKFDGTRAGIWAQPHRSLEILSHFKGIVTPDFSTYQEFPYPVKLYNTYRMRAFGYWCGQNGLEVINNVRWGTEEAFSYCFDGIEKNNIIAIGTVGGNPRRILDRPRFERGLNELVSHLEPKTILTYGSSKYPCFEKLHKMGIEIYEYPSATAEAFNRSKCNE